MHFTSEEARPSEHVLNTIRLFARAYHVSKTNGKCDTLCVN